MLCFNRPPKVLVVGDIMIDHYIYGSCTRISPEAPVPVVEVTNEEYTLGGAGNVVKNLKAFGCTVSIISVVGADSNAQLVADQLALYEVSGDSLIKDNSRCTTIKSRVLATNHQLIRLDKEDVNAVSPIVEDAVINRMEECIADCDIVLISDYNKGMLTPSLLYKITTLCRAVNVKTIVDPKGINFAKYKGVNIIKPNRKEAVLATGIAIHNHWDMEQASLKIKEITGCEEVVITLSEDGIAFYADNSLTVIPTQALDIIDVTGAGDTVLASLGIALASGNSLSDACMFANHAAAMVVSKVGSATTTLKEINQRFA